ncbi:MAG: endonuclease/exonuclease/phosphatase family protein [Candidatus Thiodiazotropha sp.]
MHHQKTLLALLLGMSATTALSDTPVFINEIHYDNTGTDVNEFVEIAGPVGTDLNGWQLVFYNGASSSLSVYSTIDLSGVLADDTASGYGFWVYNAPTNGIQNGTPDGIALVDSGGGVVQFLSYEGSFTASGGPADGMTSVDIGVAEISSTPVGLSLQLQGSGTLDSDFVWVSDLDDTPDLLNVGQSLNGSDPGDGGDGGDGGDPDSLAIYEIQGAAHSSPYAGQQVTTSGVVTAVDSNAFFVQDPLGDGDPLTSDAIYVFTQSAPGVVVGDQVEISGVVSEYTPGGSATGNLSMTQFYRPEVVVASQGNTPPDPVTIGRGGRVPPRQVIDNDQLQQFDPQEDGIDFYESLEAMRVKVMDAVAVTATNRFGEIFVLANMGEDATGMNRRGGITIGPDDFNPERIQIDFDSGIHNLYQVVDSGDRLGDVTGVVGYSYGNFEVYPTEDFTAQSGNLEADASTLVAEQERQLTIASFNLLNLDPNDGDGDADLADGRFDRLAEQIVNGLNAPDIIGLQEIQDNSGSQDDGVVDADLTLRELTKAIKGAGGPDYEYIDNPPQNNQDGGQPGGNIRVAYLFNPDTVEVDRESVTRVTDGDLSDGDAFSDSRKPLYARFKAADDEFHLINNHFSSKGGSTPLFGQVQPPVNGSEDERIAQAGVVNGLVTSILEADPEANVVVLGDLNEFEFMQPLRVLKGGDTPDLVNMTESLPALERYSYNYQGNAQALDHILVTHNLAARVEYDAVHLNSEFYDAASDHDPVLLRLNMEELDKTLRFATFNASLNRSAAGELISDLSTADDPQAKAVAEIIQRVRPDVLLLNEFDYDPSGTAIRHFMRNYLGKRQNGTRRIKYRHVYFAESNTGIPTGLDMDNDGSSDGPGDAQGFGFYPGQYGMVVLSRYPIQRKRVRSFQHFLWKDMPDSMLPTDWYSAEEQELLRLSSKSHWDIPLKVKGRVVHVLASHPTPPVFDGDEDRNGRRNHDEIRFWIDYIAGADYIYDDKGRVGGLKPGEQFVILGDLNADPHDGDSTGNPAAKLLASPLVNTSITPVSIGGADAALRQGGINTTHLGGADFDTADFADWTPGNLRVDYVLPSMGLDMVNAGVFWPAANDPLFDLVGDWPFPSSDHRLVWIDVLKKNKHRKREK